MELASLMPIRVVDQNGRTLVVKSALGKKHVRTSSYGLHSDGDLDGRDEEGKHSMEFGSIVPYDTTMTLGQLCSHPSPTS